jgi:thiamine-phosphate pyrophosphorylase
MFPRPLLYYIADRKAFAGDEPEQRLRLLQKITEAAKAGVDYIQLREKDLSSRALESLARDAVCILQQLRTENRERRTESRTSLLINSRTDIALAAAADGVHLRSIDIEPQEVKEIWQCGAGAPSTSSGLAPARNPVIGVSCHSPEEVKHAAENGATFAVFAPVFEKKDSPTAKPTGLSQLRLACQYNIPVLALGGITLANAKSCLEAGAAGIAAIRLFQENDIAEVLATLTGD